MTDTQVARPKRKGTFYIPERIKLLEPEITARYMAGESSASLAREYGISKAGVRGAVTRQGGEYRDKAKAGLLRRTVCTELSQKELADDRSVAEQVAEQLGLGTSKGLSYDRAFQTACAREYRRRSSDRYREIDRSRQEHLNRVPKWQPRKQIVDFYEMARDLGLEVDIIIPLQGGTICGLNVMSNLRLISPARNQAKQNRLLWSSDPLIGYPEGFRKGSNARSVGASSAVKRLP